MAGYGKLGCCCFGVLQWEVDPSYMATVKDLGIVNGEHNEYRQFDVTPLIAWTLQPQRGSIACSITHPSHDSVLEVSTEIGHPIRLNQIRPFFQPVLSHFPKPGTQPEILENDLFLPLLEEFSSVLCESQESLPP